MQSHELEIQLRAVINSITDGIYLTDSTGTCIAYNYAFKRITGIDIDVIGKNISYLIKNNLISEAVTLETINTQRHVSKIIKYPSGCEALVTGNPIFNENGELVAVVSTVRDITQLNTLKDELKKSKRLTEQYRAALKNIKSQSNAFFEKFVARDSKMQQIMILVRHVADSDATVMISGESGVGKGMISELIHNQSDRAQKGQFVKVDCGAIPPTLIESELFGYEKGAFTGALQTGKLGLFEIANHGTIFLDEIGELPLSLQVKLLSVIQDRCVSRVGGTKPIKIDVRILCATHRNLEEMVEEGTFRSDLYYRLNVIPVTIPPLRERKEDILVLTLSFLGRFTKKYGRSVTIAPEVLDRFLVYGWPGNVRELENIMERLVVLNQDGTIKNEDLPEKINLYLHTQQDKVRFIERQEVIPLKVATAATERKLILLALDKNKTLLSAARQLDVDISTLLRKCRKYGIRRTQDELVKMQS